MIYNLGKLPSSTFSLEHIICFERFRERRIKTCGTIAISHVFFAKKYYTMPYCYLANIGLVRIVYPRIASVCFQKKTPMGMFKDHTQARDRILTNNPEVISRECYRCPSTDCTMIFKHEDSLDYPEGEAVFDPSIDEFIAKRVVDCPRKGRHGCDFTGTIRDLRTVHEFKCPAKIVRCPNIRSCKERMARLLLGEHMRKGCNKRAHQECTWCGASVPYDKMQVHLEYCSLALRPCNLCLKTGYNADTLAAHYDPVYGMCAHLEGPCPFADVGCPLGTRVLAADERARHITEFDHNHAELVHRATMVNYDYSVAKEKGEDVDKNRGLEESSAALQKDMDDFKRDFVEQLRDMKRRVETTFADAITKSEVMSIIQNQNNALHKLEKKMQGLEDVLGQIQLDISALTIQERPPKAPEKMPYTWKCDNFYSTLSTGKKVSLLSAKFSSSSGYVFRATLYPNGYGDKETGDVSLSIAICNGSRDDHLTWPAVLRFSFAVSMVDGEEVESDRRIPRDKIITTKPWHFNKPSNRHSNGSSVVLGHFLTKEEASRCCKYHGGSLEFVLTEKE